MLFCLLKNKKDYINQISFAKSYLLHVNFREEGRIKRRLVKIRNRQLWKTAAVLKPVIKPTQSQHIPHF